MPLNFWSYAFSTASFFINRLPSSVLGFKSPWELVNSVSPSVSALRTFGCACYPYLRPSGLFVHQSKYTLDLLNKFHMADCKPCNTPCATNAHLWPNPTHYRSLVGALQYLTFTRSNLSFAVQQACQFMSFPTGNHLQAAKRILRYLKGSIHQGLAFTPGPPSLSAYSDVDWAGDPIDCK